MRLVTDAETETKTIGITIKFVIEAGAVEAKKLLETLPSDITFGGEHLWNIRVGIRGVQIEPVRVALAREDMSIDEEDTFLENG